MIPPRQPPRHQRRHGAHRKRIQQHIIHLSRTELQSRSHDAPHDGRGVEDFGVGTDEAGGLGLVWLADVWDVREEPGLDAELDCACDGGSDYLGPEEGSWAGEELEIQKRCLLVEREGGRTGFSCSVRV